MNSPRSSLVSHGAAPPRSAARSLGAGILKALRGDTLLRRLLTLYAAAVAAIICVGAAVIVFWVWPLYQGLEQREADHRQNAVLQAIHSEHDRLQDLTNTYSVWDEPFNFVAGENPQFPETDLNPPALDQIDVDGVFILNNAGEVLFEGLGTDGAAWPDLMPAVERASASAPGLRLGPDEPGKTAMMVHGGRVVLVAVRRVAHTDGSGPSPGILGLVRSVGPEMLARMSALTGTTFHLNVAGASDASVAAGDNGGIRSQAMLQDAYGDRAIRVEVLGAAEVLNLGRATITTLAVTMAAALVALAAGFALALIGAVAAPVTQLIENVGAVSRGETPVPPSRRPPAEIEELSAAFDAAFERSRQEAALHRAAHEEAMVARAAAERANQAKSRFLATMSHELRTPLNAIIGYSEMIREDSAAAGRQDDVGDLDHILTAAQGLLALINSILDFSRLESGRLPIVVEPFEVERTLKGVIAVARPAIVAKGLSLTLETTGDLGAATSDAMRIGQCLTNLLSNAAKFTSTGGITVKASRIVEASGAWLMIEVADTGIGMNEAQIKRVFEPFVQADDSISRKFGGTGLGLSITRDLVHRLGGRIGVKSAPGAGSRFFIKLPAELKAPEGAERSTAARSAA